jgi:hypothetical protein
MLDDSLLDLVDDRVGLILQVIDEAPDPPAARRAAAVVPAEVERACLAKGSGAVPGEASGSSVMMTTTEAVAAACQQQHQNNDQQDGQHDPSLPWSLDSMVPPFWRANQCRWTLHDIDRVGDETVRVLGVQSTRVGPRSPTFTVSGRPSTSAGGQLGCPDRRLARGD